MTNSVMGSFQLDAYLTDANAVLAADMANSTSRQGRSFVISRFQKRLQRARSQAQAWTGIHV